MKVVGLVMALAASGCATGVWLKAGSNEYDYKMDRGQCAAQAEMGYTIWSRERIFAYCMEGKGWEFR